MFLQIYVFSKFMNFFWIYDFSIFMNFFNIRNKIQISALLSNMWTFSKICDFFQNSKQT